MGKYTKAYSQTRRQGYQEIGHGTFPACPKRYEESRQSERERHTVHVTTTPNLQPHSLTTNQRTHRRDLLEFLYCRREPVHCANTAKEPTYESILIFFESNCCYITADIYALSL
jgi:hypothetical protein